MLVLYTLASLVFLYANDEFVSPKVAVPLVTVVPSPVPNLFTLLENSIVYPVNLYPLGRHIAT